MQTFTLYGITEADVALSDYLLFGQCLLLAWWIWRQAPAAKIARLFALFFLGVSLASFCGGTSHGFFLNSTGFAARTLWTATLVAIAGICWVMWLLAAAIAFVRAGRWLFWLGTGHLFIFLLLIFAVTQNFLVVVVNYFPLVILLLVALVWRCYRRDEPQLWWGISALIITLLAAGVQRLQISIHPYYFTHNSLYHLIQFVAFWMLAKTAGYLVRHDECT